MREEPPPPPPAADEPRAEARAAAPAPAQRPRAAPSARARPGRQGPHAGAQARRAGRSDRQHDRAGQRRHVRRRLHDGQRDEHDGRQRACASPTGVPGGTGTAQRRRRRRRDPIGRARRRSAEASEWNCPFPPEADTAQIDEAYVTLQVDVRADGTPADVRVLERSGQRLRPRGAPVRHEQALRRPRSITTATPSRGRPSRSGFTSRAERRYRAPSWTTTRERAGELAASLRAYLEWHAATPGTVRLSRRAARQPCTDGSSRAATAAPRPRPRPRPRPDLAPAPDPAPSPPRPASDRHVRLPQLAAEVAGCTKCGLSATRTQTVFARGNPDAQPLLRRRGARRRRGRAGAALRRPRRASSSTG